MRNHRSCGFKISPNSAGGGNSHSLDGLTTSGVQKMQSQEWNERGHYFCLCCSFGSGRKQTGHEIKFEN